MGRKASLKLNFDYDLDEDSFETDIWDEEFDLSKLSRSRTKKNVAPALKVKTVQEKGRGLNLNNPASSLKCMINTGRPFSKLILEQGYASLLIEIASFLSVRSITSLSCVNQRLESDLSESALYSKESPIRLPCLKMKNISCEGRALALESTLFQKLSSQKKRERSLFEIGSLCQEESVVACRFSRRGSQISCLFSNGRLILFQIEANSLKRLKSANELYNGDFLGIFSSVLSMQYCGIIVMPASGIRRYILSVVSLSCTAKWKFDIPNLDSLSLTSQQRPSVQIDDIEHRVIVFFVNQFWIFNAKDGKVLWHKVLEEELQKWSAWKVHKQYLVAISSRKKKLLVFCLNRKRLVAWGTVPKTNPMKRNKKLEQLDPDAKVPRIEICFDRIWFTRYPNLYCTGLIFRRLERLPLSQGALQPLCIRQISLVSSYVSSKPILKFKSGNLFFTDGQKIQIYSNVAEMTTVSGYETLDPKPSQVLCANGVVEFLQADSMKVVCGIREERRYRIEVFLLVPTDQLCRNVFVKNATVFQNRYKFTKMDFVRGRLLLQWEKTSNSEGGMGLYGAYGSSRKIVIRDQSQIRVLNFFQESNE